MPLIWTQTWLDPEVELGTLEEIKMNFPRPLTLMVIAGGGDLPLTLLSDPIIREIVCLDRYNGQLAITELKAQLCFLYPSMGTRLDFLEGKMEEDQFDQIYRTLRTRITSKTIWDEQLTALKSGILRSDCLRRCFRKSAALDKSKKISLDSFRFIFTNQQMIDYFGKEFINNSLNIRLSDYFYKVLKKHQDLSEKHNYKNYFYEQMKSGYYDRKNPPLYIRQPNKHIHKLSYICDDVINYLSNTKRQFDLMSLSNITDEMNYQQIDKLLILAVGRISHRGRLILRRMSGEVELHQLVNKYFVILNLSRDYLEDKTYLYQEVIVASPRQSK